MRKAASRSVRPARSRRLGVAVTVGCAAAIGPLLLLWLLGVPLGDTSYLVYRYSPAPVGRLLSLPMLLPALGLLCLGVWLMGQRDAGMGAGAGGRRVMGQVATALGIAGLAAWTWWAPPAAALQHDLNYRSPAQDGAFVNEAIRIRRSSSLGQYLRSFDQYIRGATPQEADGTRVLSNTPGATIIAYVALKLWPDAAAGEAGWLQRQLPQRGVTSPQELARSADGLAVSLAFAALWAGSALFAYLLGRLFLSAQGAAVLAVVVFFNPATAHFSPGKDAAQLLTVCAMLWAWFAAWRKDSPGLAALAGALLMVGTAVGLVHLWVALAAMAATLWHQWRTGGKVGRVLLRQVLAATAGAIALVGIVYLLSGWNMPATFLAVSGRFGQLQQTISAGLNRQLWLVIGVPLFLLFVGAGFWAFLWRAAPRWAQGGLGRRLLICTGAVMGLTYLVGVPYELPRLWIAFLPLLLLAVMVDLPLLHGRSGRRRVSAALMLVLVAHVLTTAAHWSLLDVRESEYRLVTGRMLY